MAEHLKSASVLTADAKVTALEIELRSKIARLESELETAWSTPIVIVCMAIMFITGALVGMALVS